MNNFKSKLNFKFIESKKIVFNKISDNYLTIFDKIKNNKGYQFLFESVENKNYATGPGANKEIFNILWNQFIKDNMIIKDTYFIDIDEKNDFWKSSDNIYSFVVFLGMSVNVGYTLSYHFVPAMLEIITDKTLLLNELEDYLKNIDNEIVINANKLKSEEFKLMDFDFDNHYDYFRDRLMGHVSSYKLNIYNTITEHIDFFENFKLESETYIKDFDIYQLDNVISGLYEITHDQLIPIFKINKKYSKIWNDFIHILNQEEIRSMLLLFGNSLSLNNKYHIFVKNAKTDINISTCARYITINKKLFESFETLKSLKLYFNGDDKLSDGIIGNDDQNLDHLVGQHGVGMGMGRSLLRTMLLEMLGEVSTEDIEFERQRFRLNDDNNNNNNNNIQENNDDNTSDNDRARERRRNLYK